MKQIKQYIDIINQSIKTDTKLSAGLIGDCVEVCFGSEVILVIEIDKLYNRFELESALCDAFIHLYHDYKDLYNYLIKE